MDLCLVPSGPSVLFLHEQHTEDNLRKVAQVEGIMNLPKSAGHWQPMHPKKAAGMTNDDHPYGRDETWFPWVP